MPPGVLEGTLVLVVLGFGLIVLRAVKQRRSFQKNASDTVLPNLQVQTQVSGVVTRYFRDTLQGMMLTEIGVGQSKFIFCPTDNKSYTVGEKVDIALYSLSTLEPGGFELESVKSQISDTPQEDIAPDRLVMTPAGQFPNDYWVVGKAYSSREDQWETDMLLTVYRVKTQRKGGEEFALDMAIPRETALKTPLPTNVHGSARLFGYQID